MLGNHIRAGKERIKMSQFCHGGWNFEIGCLGAKLADSSCFRTTAGVWIEVRSCIPSLEWRADSLAVLIRAAEGFGWRE